MGHWRWHSIFKRSGGFVTIIARLIFVCLLLAALIYGGLWALATFVEPDIQETTIAVPASRFAK